MGAVKEQEWVAAKLGEAHRGRVVGRSRTRQPGTACGLALQLAGGAALAEDADGAATSSTAGDNSRPSLCCSDRVLGRRHRWWMGPGRPTHPLRPFSLFSVLVPVNLLSLCIWMDGMAGVAGGGVWRRRLRRWTPWPRSPERATGGHRSSASLHRPYSPPCPAVYRRDGGDGSERLRVLDDGTCSRWSTSPLISLVVPAHLVLSRCYTDPRSGVPPSPPVLQRHNRAYEEDDRSWWRHTSLKFMRKLKIYVPVCYRPRQENLGQMQDRQAEVTRLMEHVATSKKSIRGLKLDKAYFANPKFSSVMAD